MLRSHLKLMNVIIVLFLLSISVSSTSSNKHEKRVALYRFSDFDLEVGEVEDNAFIAKRLDEMAAVKARKRTTNNAELEDYYFPGSFDLRDCKLASDVLTDEKDRGQAAIVTSNVVPDVQEQEQQNVVIEIHQVDTSKQLQAKELTLEQALFVRK
jgi:hypothetical protein